VIYPRETRSRVAAALHFLKQGSALPRKQGEHSVVEPLMASDLTTVLWISAAGAAVLFAACAALIGLIYLLTTPWPIR
jgi:hypothetical protein